MSNVLDREPLPNSSAAPVRVGLDERAGDARDMLTADEGVGQDRTVSGNATVGVAPGITWPQFDQIASAYFSRAGEDLPVLVDRGPRHGGTSVDGRLIDLSRTGTRFTIENKLDVNETVRLTIRVEKEDWEVCGPARVTGVRPRAANWEVSCQFVELLDEEILNKLSASALLERRRDDRLPVEGRATIRQESRDDVLRVKLEDVSMGGFCLSCPSPLILDERLLFQLETDEESLCFAARAQWQTKVDDYYLVGCSFLNAHSAHALNDRLGVLARSRPTSSPQSACRMKNKHLRWGLVLAVATGLVGALCYLLFG